MEEIINMENMEEVAGARETMSAESHSRKQRKSTRKYSKKEKAVRGIARGGLFVVLFAVFFGLLASMLHVNDIGDSATIRGYYMEQEDSLDVVFLGASEIMTGVCPGQIWAEQGFTSYNYAINQNNISLYKYEIAEILKTQNPKLIVIEINGLVHGDDYCTDEATYRRFLDNIEHDENWKAAVNELVPEDDRKYYRVPFLKYHSNWTEPGNLVQDAKVKSHIRKNGATLKGARINPDTLSDDQVAELLDIPGTLEPRELSEISQERFIDLLDWLDEQNIDNVLFIRAPHLMRSDTQYMFEAVLSAQQQLQERSYKFIDFDYMIDEIGFDRQHDFYNSEHLNVAGQRKFTSYFAAMLAEMYGLSDIEHSEELAAYWDDCAAESADAQAYALQKLSEGKSGVVAEGWR